MLDYKETAESPYFWSHISTNCETLGNNAITLANCLQFNRGSINANGYNFSYYYIQFTKSSSKKKKPLLDMYHTIWANTTSSYNVYKIEMGLKMENAFGNVF